MLQVYTVGHISKRIVKILTQKQPIYKRFVTKIHAKIIILKLLVSYLNNTIWHKFLTRKILIIDFEKKLIKENSINITHICLFILF